jgi:hypothetical protein
LLSLSRSIGVSKNQSCHIDFQNVHLTLEKMHQKRFAQKPIFLELLANFPIAK